MLQWDPADGLLNDRHKIFLLLLQFLVIMMVHMNSDIKNLDQNNKISLQNKKFLRFVVMSLFVAIFDIFILGLSFLGASLIHIGELKYAHGGIIFSIVGPLYLLKGVLDNAFYVRPAERMPQFIMKSIKILSVVLVSLLLIGYFAKIGSEISRVVFLFGSVSAFFGLIFVRATIYKMGLKKIATPMADLVIVDRVEFQSQGAEVVMDVSAIGFDPLSKDPYAFHRLAGIVAEYDRVLVACPETDRLGWALALKGLAIRCELAVAEPDFPGVIGLGEFGKYQTWVVNSGALSLPERLLKRIIDISVSLIAVILLSPVMFLTAIMIKMESAGPIFFMQERVGRHNRLFRMYKFRSMYTDLCDHDASQLTLRGDSRVTKVGEFIRRSSIDELPQLFNVLFGAMSIVGPRPHALSAKAGGVLYWDVDPRYRHRHCVRPGITGLAQVLGYRGNTETIESLEDRLAADLKYVSNWSLWLDVQIIAKTFMVLRHSNAF